MLTDKRQKFTNKARYHLSWLEKLTQLFKNFFVRWWPGVMKWIKNAWVYKPTLIHVWDGTPLEIILNEPLYTVGTMDIHNKSYSAISLKVNYYLFSFFIMNVSSLKYKVRDTFRRKRRKKVKKVPWNTGFIHPTQ